MHKLNLPYHESGFAMCMFNDGVNCKLSQLKSGSQNYTKEEKQTKKEHGRWWMKPINTDWQTWNV